MIALPPALRPWSKELGIFPPEVALGLGGMVTRLDAAIGPLRGDGHERNGEHAGYAGITRRGLPERLLLSEWAIALEVPEEFLRRAAMSEQAFLEPELRRPKATRRTIALLDCGPSQLGTPRIVQLALLLVLARRAEAAGLTLEWVVLQRDGKLRSGFGHAEAAAFLEARSLNDVSTESVDRAIAMAEGVPPRELWLIGGAELHARTSELAASRIRIDEPWDVPSTRIDVAVKLHAGSKRALQLPLPTQRELVRLFRDPFGRATVPAVAPKTMRYPRVATPESFGLAPGARLLYRSVAGELVSIAIPNSARAGLPRPKRIPVPRDEVFLAAGWRHVGGLFAITRTDEHVRIHGPRLGYLQTSVFDWRWRKDELFVNGFPARPLQNGHPFSLAFSAEHGVYAGRMFYCRDRDGKVVQLDASRRTMEVLHSDSAAIHLTSAGRLVSARDGNFSTYWELETIDAPHQRPLIVPIEVKGYQPQAFFGFPAHRPHAEWDLCALETSAHVWKVIHKDGDFDVHVGPERRVVGAMIAPLGRRWEGAHGMLHAAASPAGVVVRSEDDRKLQFWSAVGEHDLFTTPRTIKHAMASTHSPHLAVATDQELVVLTMNTLEPVLRIPIGPAP